MGRDKARAATLEDEARRDRRELVVELAAEIAVTRRVVALHEAGQARREVARQLGEVTMTSWLDDLERIVAEPQADLDMDSAFMRAVDRRIAEATAREARPAAAKAA